MSLKRNIAANYASQIYVALVGSVTRSALVQRPQTELLC